MKKIKFYKTFLQIGPIIGLFILASAFELSKLAFFGVVLIVVPIVSLLLDIRGLLLDPENAKRELKE